MRFRDSRISWGARYDYDMHNAYFAAETVGRFTIGVIAAYDANGPMVEAIGTQSWIGVNLVVKWRNLVCYDLWFSPRTWTANILNRFVLVYFFRCYPPH